VAKRWPRDVLYRARPPGDVGGRPSYFRFVGAWNAQALFMIPVALATSGNLAPYTYDVMPDGQRFLAVAPVADAASPTMTVLLN